MVTCEQLPDPWHKTGEGNGQTSLDSSGKDYTGCLSPTLPHSGASEQRGHSSGGQNTDEQEPKEGQELLHRSMHGSKSKGQGYRYPGGLNLFCVQCE